MGVSVSVGSGHRIFAILLTQEAWIFYLLCVLFSKVMILIGWLKVCNSEKLLFFFNGGFCDLSLSGHKQSCPILFQLFF